MATTTAQPTRPCRCWVETWSQHDGHCCFTPEAPEACHDTEGATLATIHSRRRGRNGLGGPAADRLPGSTPEPRQKALMATRRHAELLTVTSPGFGGHSEVDALDIGSPAWTIDALCAQTDPEAFFPEKGGSTREAKAICTGCRVQVECLDYALANEERFGIWGGLSERERRKLARPRSAIADKPCRIPGCDRVFASFKGRARHEPQCPHHLDTEQEPA